MNAAVDRWARRGKGRAAGAVLAALACLGTTRLSADDTSGIARERDSVFKFSFSKPENWAPVPVAPDEAEHQVVRKYVQKDAQQKGVRPEALFVLRSEFEKAHKAGEDEVQEADKPPADLVEILKKWISHSTDGHAAFVAPKHIKSKDDVPGRMWVIEAKDGLVKKDLHVLAVWVKPEEQYAMWLSCGDDQRRRNEDVFLRIVQSFQWHDAKSKEAVSITSLKDLALPEGKRKSIEEGLVKGWNVIVSPKKQYVIVYNTKGKRNDRLAQMVAERIEQIREALYETQFPPKKKIEEVSIVRICGDELEYVYYGGPWGSAGYWSWRDGELVLYDAHPAAKLDEDTLATAYHEAFHQYIFYGAGKISPPSWFNEGHGDYYAGARSAGDKFKVRPFNWRVKTIKAACRKGPCPKKADGTFDRQKGGYTPLVDFLRFSKGDYYDDETVHLNYAQGWSVIYFLREIVPTNPAWKEKWGNILDTYYLTLRGSEVKKPAALPKKAGVPGESKKPRGIPDDPGPVPPEEEDPPAGVPDKPVAPPPKADGDEDGGINDMPKVAREADYDDAYGDIDAAFEAAFKGVDLKELEAAWRAAIQQVPG
jgi:hypothetical protein